MNAQHNISSSYAETLAPVRIANVISIDSTSAVIGATLDYYGLRTFDTIRQSYDMTPTGKTYAAALRQFFEWVHATGRHVGTLTHMDLEQYSARFAVKNENGKSIYSPATRKVYLTAVRQFFKMMAAELNVPNPSANIKPVRVHTDGTHSHKPFTPDQESALLESVRMGTTYTTPKRGTQRTTSDAANRRDYAIVRLLDKMGLRTIEVIRLDVGDLHIEGETYVLDVRGKGDRPRTLPVPPNTLSAIMDYIRHERRGAKPSDPLFVSLDHRPEHNGQRMTTATISRMAKRHARAIGVDDKQHTAHSLRTTCGCRIFTATESITDVQMALGHADPKTSEIYARDAMAETFRKNSPLFMID